MKHSIIFFIIFIFSISCFSQSSSLNVGFSFLGIKDQNPRGGGLHIGYEYQVPKINFFALEARVGGGFLMGDGLYKTTPIREWDYKANYLMAGIIPRLYLCVADELYLFLDPEIGIAQLSGSTYFEEQNRWNKTKTYNYNYYAIRVGVKAPINEKLKISMSFGYNSLDITNLMNSGFLIDNYHFKKQTLDFSTSFTFHVIL